MRAAQFFIILGIALLLASYVPGSFTIRGDLIDRTHYQCLLVNGSGNLYVEAWGRDNRNISLYVLDYENTIVLVSEGALENASPLFYRENVANYTGYVTIPRPGWYGVVVTAEIDNPAITEMRFDVHLTRATPYVVPFLLFVISEVLGAALFLYKKREKQVGII